MPLDWNDVQQLFSYTVNKDLGVWQKKVKNIVLWNVRD